MAPRESKKNLSSHLQQLFITSKKKHNERILIKSTVTVIMLVGGVKTVFLPLNSDFQSGEPPLPLEIDRHCQDCQSRQYDEREEQTEKAGQEKAEGIEDTAGQRSRQGEQEEPKEVQGGEESERRRPGGQVVYLDHWVEQLQQGTVSYHDRFHFFQLSKTRYLFTPWLISHVSMIITGIKSLTKSRQRTSLNLTLLFLFSLLSLPREILGLLALLASWG